MGGLSGLGFLGRGSRGERGCGFGAVDCAFVVNTQHLILTGIATF